MLLWFGTFATANDSTSQGHVYQLSCYLDGNTLLFKPGGNGGAWVNCNGF